MITPLMMWAIITLDAFGVALLVSVAICVILAVFWWPDDETPEDKKDHRRKVAKRHFFAATILAVTCIVTPSTRQMAVILTVPAIASSELVQEASPMLKQLAIEWLEDQVDNKEDKSAAKK